LTIKKKTVATDIKVVEEMEKKFKNKVRKKERDGKRRKKIDKHIFLVLLSSPQDVLDRMMNCDGKSADLSGLKLFNVPDISYLAATLAHLDLSFNEMTGIEFNFEDFMNLQ
jgi:hypothetical protein